MYLRVSVCLSVCECVSVCVCVCVDRKRSGMQRRHNCHDETAAENEGGGGGGLGGGMAVVKSAEPVRFRGYRS